MRAKHKDRTKHSPLKKQNKVLLLKNKTKFPFRKSILSSVAWGLCLKKRQSGAKKANAETLG